MDTQNNPSQPRTDRASDALSEDISLQNSGLLANDPDSEEVIYADLGIQGQPDGMNPGDDEATDTVLYTDNQVARFATENVASDETIDDLPEALLDDEDSIVNEDDVYNDPDELAAERDNDDKDSYLAY
jgi:hypothetical protein